MRRYAYCVHPAEEKAVQVLEAKRGGFLATRGCRAGLGGGMISISAEITFLENAYNWLFRN